MRAAAAVLVTTASVCTGLLLRDRIRRRVQILSQFCLFLREVRLRARLREPLDVQIRLLSESSALFALTFLPDCAARIGQGQPLPPAWAAAVEAFLQKHSLPREQSGMLMQCIPALSDADGTRVEGLLELYETRAVQALEKAEQTEASAGTLLVRVFGAAGLLLGILIL